jgi:hypothetical protein
VNKVAGRRGLRTAFLTWRRYLQSFLASYQITAHQEVRWTGAGVIHYGKYHPMIAED